MEEKRTNNTKKGILIGCGISALLLTGFFGSYAYFMGNLGSNKQEEVSTQAGTLALTFADGNNGITEALEFGGSVEKTFSIENTGSLDATARIMWDDLVNTYIDGSLTYTLSSSDTETGTYTNIVENQNVPTSTTSTKELLAGNLSIPTGTTKYYKLTITLNYLDDVDQTADLKASLSTHFSIEESDGKDVLNAGIETTLAKIGKNILTEKPSFTATATTDETKDGLFSIEDDYGTSYYYRGAVTDNYVQFGNWASDESVDVSLRGKPMYWRIIRVNGDGSVRMIYDGTQAYANGNASIDRLALRRVAWNPTFYNDAKYVGYMYGGTNETASTKRVNLGEAGYNDVGNSIYNQTDSNIKVQIEKWYHNNLSERDENIADVIYCNDRSISETSKEWWVSEGTTRGYGANATAYGGWSRFLATSSSAMYNNTNPTPSLKCKDKNDTFTKEESGLGNGKLNEKVGLITVDEISIAGGRGGSSGTNKSYYLYKGAMYWSLSPNSFSGSYVYAFKVATDGSLSHDYIYSSLNVAPVISLTPEYFVTLIGDGTIGNEYRES